MADDTRETQTQSASADSISSLPPKKLPKGMILGKDGKPYATFHYSFPKSDIAQLPDLQLPLIIYLPNQNPFHHQTPGERLPS